MITVSSLGLWTWSFWGWVNEAAGTHMFESDPVENPGLPASLCHWSQGWESLGRCPVTVTSEKRHTHCLIPAEQPRQRSSGEPGTPQCPLLKTLFFKTLVVHFSFLLSISQFTVGLKTKSPLPDKFVTLSSQSN